MSTNQESPEKGESPQSPEGSTIPFTNSDWLLSAITSGGIGLWRWDVAKDETIWTNQLYHVLGYRPDEVERSIGGFQAVIHPDDREKVSLAIADALKSDEFRFECRICGPTGKVIWIQSVGRVIRDESGNAAVLEGAAYDISRRIEAERELLETHTSYQRAVSTAGIVAYHYDFNGDAYRAANLNLMEEMFGQPYLGSHKEMWDRIVVREWIMLGEMFGMRLDEAIQKERRRRATPRP